MKFSAIILGSAIAAAAFIPEQADAHAFLMKPAIQLTTGDKNMYAYVVDGNKVPPFSSYTTGNAESNSKGFETNYKKLNPASLKAFIMANQQRAASGVPAGGTAECGYSKMDQPALPLPDQIEFGNYQLSNREGIHPGPCEAWCDDDIVVPFTMDCRTILNKPIAYDKSKCAGKKRLTFYWLATHFAPFQVYIGCAPLSGGGAASSGGAAAGGAAAGGASAGGAAAGGAANRNNGNGGAASGGSNGAAAAGGNAGGNNGGAAAGGNNGGAAAGGNNGGAAAGGNNGGAAAGGNNGGAAAGGNNNNGGNNGAPAGGNNNNNGGNNQNKPQGGNNGGNANNNGGNANNNGGNTNNNGGNNGGSNGNNGNNGGSNGGNANNGGNNNQNRNNGGNNMNNNGGNNQNKPQGGNNGGNQNRNAFAGRSLDFDLLETNSTMGHVATHEY